MLKPLQPADTKPSQAIIIKSPPINLAEKFKVFFKDQKQDVRALDGLFYGYCKYTSVLTTAEKWLETEYVKLKSNATSDSLNWVQKIEAQVKKIRSSIYIPQILMNVQMKKFQEKYPNYDEKKPVKRDAKTIFNEGHCSGYGAYVGYGLFLQHSKQRTDEKGVAIPRDDWEYIKTFFEKIVSIDMDLPLSEQAMRHIEKFFSKVAMLQRNTLAPPWQGDWHELYSDTRGRIFEKPYTLAAPVIEWDLDYILGILLAKASAPTKNPRIFLFSSPGHDFILVQYPENKALIFYDSNNLTGIIYLCDIQAVRKLIYLAADFKEQTPSPLGIRVFSSEEKLNFPSQPELLKNLWTIKNNKLENNDLTYFNGQTCHGMAVIIGCIPSLEFLHARKPSFKYTNFIARKEVVEFLISKKINLYIFDKQMMHTAIRNYDIALMKVLVAHDHVYLNALDMRADTPLHVAIEEEFDEGVELLLSQYVFHFPNLQGKMPLDLALEKGNLAVLKVFHRYGFTELRDVNGDTPLHRAARQNNAKHAQLLLAAGVRSSVLTTKEHTRAYWLAKNPEVKQILLQGLLLEMINKKEHFLVRNALRKKPDLKRRLLDGDTLANYTARFGDALTMKILIESGMLINEKGLRGETALHIAAGLNKPAMTEILVNRGADTNIARRDGKKPHELTNNRKVLEFIEKAKNKASDFKAPNKSSQRISIK